MNSELELGSINIHLVLRQPSKTLLTHSRKYIICWCVSRIKHYQVWSSWKKVSARPLQLSGPLLKGCPIQAWWPGYLSTPPLSENTWHVAMLALCHETGHCQRPPLLKCVPAFKSGKKALLETSKKCRQEHSISTQQIDCSIARVLLYLGTH